MKFTRASKNEGELIVRSMSKVAQAYYYNNEGIGICVDDGKIYASLNYGSPYDEYTFESLERTFEELQAELEREIAADDDFVTMAQVVECSDYDCQYGILTVKNVRLKEIQTMIYEIKNRFYDEGFNDWCIDDVFEAFPDDWEWEFVQTSPDDVLEI